MRSYHTSIENINNNTHLLQPIYQSITTTTPLFNNINVNFQQCDCIVCFNNIGNNTINTCVVDTILNNMNNALIPQIIPQSNIITAVVPLQIKKSNNISFSNQYASQLFNKCSILLSNKHAQSEIDTTSIKPKLSNRGRKKIDRSEHLNEKGRYQCKLCPKSYKRYNDLKGHIAVHKDDTKCCPHCKKKFSRPVYLRDHIRTHTGEKPFECEICRKRFCAKRNLAAHKKRHFRENSRV